MSDSSPNSTSRRFHAFIVLLAVGVMIGGAAVAHADQFDEKINALNAENAVSRGAVNSLQGQATSYQDAINKLQTRIDSVRAQIVANQAEQSKLQAQIAANKAEVADKKSDLGATIKAMYIDGSTTTIEQLASSSNLSEFVDKEEYRNAVQGQLNDKIREIARLQAKLQNQKFKLDGLIDSQQAQRSQLTGDQNEQNELLAYNQGQQSVYNQQIARNSSKIADLRRQQIAANARFIGGGYGSAGSGPACGGGYPGIWCNAPMDSIIDTWGMYNRECVSYTAFRVAASGRHMPYWGGIGNANQWDDNARRAGIPVSTSPRAGDVAISNSGFYGHAMYVERVNSNGTIFISQYNAALNGRYSTNTISKGGLVFIHFR